MDTAMARTYWIACDAQRKDIILYRTFLILTGLFNGFNPRRHRPLSFLYHCWGRITVDRVSLYMPNTGNDHYSASKSKDSHLIWSNAVDFRWGETWILTGAVGEMNCTTISFIRSKRISLYWGKCPRRSRRGIIITKRGPAARGAFYTAAAAWDTNYSRRETSRCAWSNIRGPSSVRSLPPNFYGGGSHTTSPWRTAAWSLPR